MIDRALIGAKSEPSTVDVEKGQLKFFAKAIGESNPIYTDEQAAKAAGYRALPAPPTFAFSLSLSGLQEAGLMSKLGIDFRRLLHGEQHFEYFGPICAGDTITLQDEIADIYDKKGGVLEFFVLATTATNQNGECVAKMRNIGVVRN